MSDQTKYLKSVGGKRHRTRFWAELEVLKKDPLYEKALEEVILMEKKRNEVCSVELSFSVHYATLFGEKMAVIGEGEFLGNWDPSRALEMDWNEGNIWKCTALTSVGVAEIPYKYICIRGTLVKWETGDNRIIDLRRCERSGDKITASVEDIWKR